MDRPERSRLDASLLVFLIILMCVAGLANRLTGARWMSSSMTPRAPVMVDPVCTAGLHHPLDLLSQCIRSSLTGANGSRF